MDWLKSLFRRNRITKFGKGEVVWIEGKAYEIHWHSYHLGQLNIVFEEV